MAVVETSIHFLARDDLYEREKPYQIKFDVAEGIPTTNYTHVKQEHFKINNIRGREEQFSFEKNGFTVLKLDEDVSYDDFDSPAGIHRYLDIVAEQLRLKLDADTVQVYQFLVRLRLLNIPAKYVHTDATKIRRRDAGFPVANEDRSYEFNQPATIAHVGPYKQSISKLKLSTLLIQMQRHHCRRSSKHVPKSEQGSYRFFARSSLASCQVGVFLPL